MKKRALQQLIDAWTPTADALSTVGTTIVSILKHASRKEAPWMTYSKN